MTITQRKVTQSTAPVVRLQNGEYRQIGPLPPEVVTKKAITGNIHVTYEIDLPFVIPLDGIQGLQSTADPRLKSMSTAATGGETLISQALPDGAPNAQYTRQSVGDNVDSISFANADKLSTVARLTSGLMTAAAFDFTSGNAARDAMGVPQRQLHGCMYWHNGNPTGWAPAAGNVKSQIDIINAAYKKNWDDRGYTATLKYIDVVNEIVDNAVSPSYVKNSPLTAAFRASTEWKSEMEALGVPAITADPGAFGFLYFLKKSLETWGADKEYAIADYHYAETTSPYGYGSNPDGFYITAHQSQRWERGCFNIRNAMRAHRAGYVGRIDNVNFQSHLSSGRVIVPADIIWRNYEANMLGLGVIMGEMNLLVNNAESVAPLGAVGIAPGTPEELVWNINYVATHLAIMRASCAKLKMIQPWTDKTDFGDGALTTWDAAGNLEVVARAIQKVMMVNIPKKAVRAGRTLLAKATGFRPYELEGTISSGGPSGIRGTDLKLPMTRYLRRDPADGMVKDMSATRWEHVFLMFRSGSAAAVSGGRAWSLEDAAGNVVLSLGFSASGNMTMTTSAGTVDLGFTNNGDYIRTAVQYREGVLKVCMSRRSSAEGNPVTTTAVFQQAVNLPAIAKIGMLVGTSNSTAIEHRIYDETDLSATDADMQNRATLTPNTGAAVRAADIYSGASVLAYAA